jgi:hypothetical protein
MKNDDFFNQKPSVDRIAESVRSTIKKRLSGKDLKQALSIAKEKK